MRLNIHLQYHPASLSLGQSPEGSDDLHDSSGILGKERRGQRKDESIQKPSQCKLKDYSKKCLLLPLGHCFHGRLFSGSSNMASVLYHSI